MIVLTGVGNVSGPDCAQGVSGISCTQAVLVAGGTIGDVVSAGNVVGMGDVTGGV